jgi:hypothetical protein
MRRYLNPRLHLYVTGFRFVLAVFLAVLFFSPACYRVAMIMNAMPTTITVAVVNSAFVVLP